MKCSLRVVLVAAVAVLQPGGRVTAQESREAAPQPALKKALTKADLQKLREAVELPRISTTAMFGVVHASRIEWWKWGPEELAKEMVNQKKAMKGDDSDAERYLVIARGCRDKEAETAAARAVELFRKRLKLDPRNGRLHARLSEALGIAGSFKEAEQAAHRAAELGPDDWQCWRQLAVVQYGALVLALNGDKAPDLTPEP